MTSITPFALAVTDAELDDLRQRLRHTRLPLADPAGDWSRGVPNGYLASLVAYWADGFSWREMESRLNRLPQFLTEIDDQPIHFVHLKSSTPGALPLLLCHGWPGGFVEFAALAETLAAEGFDIVVPSLPGFGYSTPLAGPGWTMARAADAFATLMERLGYPRYGIHGSDIGSGIAGRLAALHPDRVVGTHVASDSGTLAFVGTFLPQPDDLAPDEVAELDRLRAAARDGSGYMQQQSSKPQTLAFGLADSPAGQLAWIAEKFAEWTDPARPLPDEAVDRDLLLALVSLYWFTNSGGASAQIYWENAHAGRGWLSPSDVPQGWAVFNTHPLMRRVMDPEHRMAHWSEFAVGGHFPAMEQPTLLAQDIAAFFSGPGAAGA